MVALVTVRRGRDMRGCKLALSFHVRCSTRCQGDAAVMLQPPELLSLQNYYLNKSLFFINYTVLGIPYSNRKRTEYLPYEGLNED
jgi:hypothetical protein